MHSDLSLHLHSEECREVIKKLLKCRADNPVRKFVGVCNQFDLAVDRCLKKERKERRVQSSLKAANSKRTFMETMERQE